MTRNAVTRGDCQSDREDAGAEHGKEHPELFLGPDTEEAARNRERERPFGPYASAIAR